MELASVTLMAQDPKNVVLNIPGMPKSIPLQEAAKKARCTVLKFIGGLARYYLADSTAPWWSKTLVKVIEVISGLLQKNCEDCA